MTDGGEKFSTEMSPWVSPGTRKGGRRRLHQHKEVRAQVPGRGKDVVEQGLKGPGQFMRQELIFERSNSVRWGQEKKPHIHAYGGGGGVGGMKEGARIETSLARWHRLRFQRGWGRGPTRGCWIDGGQKPRKFGGSV